ncbi:MAG: P63C domain-containing protein [Rubrivivax sp.]|nr:P63C domain-containing protein [Rubrivivax sp.]
MSEPTGKARGGLARAEALSTERRREIGQQAAAARWEQTERLASLPIVLLAKDPLDLAGIQIPCAIIEGDGDGDGEPRRVLSENGIATALLGGRSGASKRLKKADADEGRSPLPVFLAPGQLKEFINRDLESGPLLRPIEYADGNRVVIGYDARILPVVCEIWLRAREAGALQKQQLDKAQKAEVLMRALAHIGIIALVDEATGYQDIRPRDALARILEAFVAKELRPWVRKFPPEYYKEIFRLRGLHFPEGTVRRPQYFGHLTNDIVYRRLAPGVWKELKERVEKDERGRPKHRLHQHLTENIGDPRLQKVLTQVTTIMQLSSAWPDFKEKLDRLVPAYNETMQLPFEISSDDGKGL